MTNQLFRRAEIIETLRAENAVLKEQVAEQAREIERLKVISDENDERGIDIDVLVKQLAENQARQVKLRKALLYGRTLYLEAGSDMDQLGLDALHAE